MNPMQSDHHPRPEDFLELVERTHHGRLKIYLGYAAGVGKTYQMLREAHQLQKRGVDVVLGYIETHGRADTARLIEGLEVVPRKRIEYRGVIVEEMDLEAVLARKPQVAIVDEVAHTNIPGMKNSRRYQDIVELTEAGINVICAFNIQHLESLNDLVGRATGVTVRETVPDTFLKRADQIVTLDLAVEDLLERLRGGKIYAEDKIPWALEHFFKDGNLATLRELVLREVAESLDRKTAAKIQDRRTRRHPALGRARDGLHRLLLAARPHDAAARLAHGRPAEYPLVHGLRRDAQGGAASDRRRSPAPPGRDDGTGARTGR